MADFERLIDVELKIQHLKEEEVSTNGFKLYLFEALYSIQQYFGIYKFLDLTFIIIEFIQLIAFPMDKTFNINQSNLWAKTIGNFFRYFQLTYLWNNSSFFIIAYILICIYIIILLSLFLHILIKNKLIKSNAIMIVIAIMIQLLIILNIPFLRTLFAVFSCHNNSVEIYQEIKCKSIIHIILIIISFIFIIIFKLFIIVFHYLVYEFGHNSNILKSGYTSSTEVMLDIAKFLLIIIYQFISNEIALSIISLALSVILLIHFLIIQPYSNNFTMKLYLLLYIFFFWSCCICIISIFLRNSEFKSGIVLLMLGYPFILIVLYIREGEYYIEKVLSYVLYNKNKEYNILLSIEYLLKLEDSLSEKIRTKEHKLLFTYIINHESKCTQQNCYIKMFLKIPFNVKNFKNLKVLLLQYAEILYKEGISKQPNNIKLRLSYILFLIKKMNKTSKGKNELLLLNKFEQNLECSFIIYKMQKYLDENDEKKEFENNINYSQSISNKAISNEIKTLIDNIIINYIKFWNILLNSNMNNQNNFSEMNKLGQKIKSLNNELNTKIKSLDSWNLLEQDTIKIYIHYLKEIINNNEKAITFKKKLSDEYEDKHVYNDINLYQLNYEEMAKNEDYKYIIVNLSKNNFNKISNISFSVCKEFGYMKKELIGHSSDILFPEIFNNFRKIFFQNKIEEYKQKLLNTKNKIINSDIWTGDCFGINKIKFLFPFKAKWTIITSEDDQLYGVGSIFLQTNKILDSKDHEIIYVLTDLNFNIQNYSSNAPELLNLDINIGSKIINITNYINELNENLKSKNDKEGSNISNISIKRKNNSKVKRRLSRTEILKRYSFFEKNKTLIICWKKKEDINNINKLKNKNDFNFNNLIHSHDDDNLNNSIIKFNPKRVSIENIQKPKLERFHTVSQKYKSEMNFGLNYDKNLKENTQNKNHGKLFFLKVEEAKLHEFKVGYIFILRPYIEKNKLENNSASKDIINIQEKNMTVSDISITSFGEEKKKFNCTQTIIGPFNLNNQNNDIFLQDFALENEYQFSFDVKDMTYKQFKYIEEKNSFFENIKEKAIKKITDAQKAFQKEEDEEEEESSEGENTEDEDENENDSNSNKEISKDKNEELIKDENKNLIEEKNENSYNNNKIKNKSKKASIKKPLLNQILIQNILENVNEINKKKEDNFYRVNFDKIDLYIFNYSLGFVELQKGKAQKISQVDNIINAEKEKLKNSNSRYIVNHKLIKGKKKLNINKKEENEITNIQSESSLKIKEIYNALSSEKRESVITKIIFVSIIIFILIIGAGIVNILIYRKIKNDIFTFFILIEKSDNLYQNLLFSLALIKEMIILNYPFYTNPMYDNKQFFYQILSKMLYNFYIENTFILSNLTNNFNILSEEEEENITKNTVKIYILDKLQTNLLNYYQYKNYDTLLYSAYRELNSALYHIVQLKQDEIHYYNDDVYYFLKNGMSDLLISSEKQMWILTEKFEENIKEGHEIIIICCCVIFLVFCFCTFIFIFFYKKVNAVKNRYMSIFSELDNDLIFSSLNKCEKFSQKLQEKKDNKEMKNKNELFYSSSLNNSENGNDNNILDNKNMNNKIYNYKNGQKEKNKKSFNFYIYPIIIFSIIFIYQLAIYIYYYLRMTNYQRVVTYEYHISMFASNFLFIFISLREYIFDKKIIFYNQTVEEYLEENLQNYYVIFADKSKRKDTYRVYFPHSYQKFLNYLYNGKMCEFISAYNRDNPNKKQLGCDEFFYGSSGQGFFNLLTTFVEEIRSLKDKIDTYYSISEKKNFVYNESYFNGPNAFYRELYDKYSNNIDEYERYNPANILKSNSHRELFITYNYINIQVYSSLISESLSQFEQIFSKYNNINLIINILFIIIVIIGFIFLWIPFMYVQNKNFKNIKVMLSIIPSELLSNINNINNLLEIEESIM